MFIVKHSTLTGDVIDSAQLAAVDTLPEAWDVILDALDVHADSNLSDVAQDTTGFASRYIWERRNKTEPGFVLVEDDNRIPHVFGIIRQNDGEAAQAALRPISI